MYRLTATMMISALALGFQGANATPPQPGPDLLVHFADLDLSASTGAKTLYQRLHTAAETVCAPLDIDRNSLAMHRVFEACVQSAVGTAVEKAHQPALTAYYEASTNGRNGAAQVAQSR